jgi:hypothetical protein
VETMKVVLRYTDGAIRKGYTPDFDPDRPTFHFQEDAPGASPMEMGVDGLKALFLVRSLEGSPHYSERKEFVEGDKSYGDKVEVTFGDGEVMQGSSMGYHPDRLGVFLMPPDPKSNNILVYAVLPAVERFRYL